MLPDDRTVRARIRDAAIELVAARGVESMTARGVAAASGVSAGTVVNHFGSMAGLRRACDEHVAAVIRDHELGVMAAGADMDVLAALRSARLGPLLGYLAAVLHEDSEEVNRLVDDLVDDAVGYLGQGVASGVIRSTDDPRARAVVLTLWGLGTLVMHRHLQRLLGVDLVGDGGADDAALAAYVRPAYDLYGHGLFTDQFARHAQDALARLEPRRGGRDDRGRDREGTR